MVYIYETLSENLHRFVDPRLATASTRPFYASNGICARAGHRLHDRAEFCRSRRPADLPDVI